MFLGYPRSGHSLLGALLDAHRHAVIAHELHALRHVHAGAGRKRLFSRLCAQSRAFADQGNEWTGYSYSVPGQWQGRVDRLVVIGDKKGGGSAKWLRKHPDSLERLERLVRVPVKLIHMVRNPYDNITTIAARNELPLDEAARRYFRLCKTIQPIVEARGRGVTLIRHEDLIEDPRTHLSAVCAFLGLDAPSDYLAACSAVVFPSPQSTRLRAAWTSELIADVSAEMARYPFLKGYSYETRPTPRLAHLREPRQ